MRQHHLQEVLFCETKKMPRLVLLLAAVAAFATPSRLLKNQDLRHEWLSGVARLRTGLTCTAFLIQPVPSPDSPVYLLTNGHGPLGAAGNEVVRNARVQAGSAATFHYFFDTPARRLGHAADCLAAGVQQAHARRVAELTGSAWDAHEAFKLKELREQQAEFRAEEAKVARTEAAALEREYLKELRLEKARKL
jgi:hypothetical protein